MNEADRPVKRLRRKRRLLLESEDDEENADEDEVNEALVFSLESRDSSLSQISLCNASGAEGGCSAAMRMVWV